MKKRVLTLLSLGMLLMMFSAAFADPYRHPETALVFPDRLAGMDRVRITDYEKDKPGLGVGIGYNARGITLTIFLYKLGMQSIPEDVDSPVLRRQFEQAAHDIKTVADMGEYLDLKRLNEAETVLISGKTGLKALSASFSYFQKNAGIDRLSKLYLMGYKNHFLKIRYTYDKDMQAEGEATLRQFLDELAKIIEATH